MINKYIILYLVFSFNGLGILYAAENTSESVIGNEPSQSIEPRQNSEKKNNVEENIESGYGQINIGGNLWLPYNGYFYLKSKDEGLVSKNLKGIFVLYAEWFSENYFGFGFIN